MTAWRPSGRTATLIACALVATLLEVVAAAPAYAASGRVLAQPDINVRAFPAGTSALIAHIPYNKTVTINCTTRGTSVTGPYGASRIWDNVTYKGVTGYVSDAFMFTGSANAVAPDCSTVVGSSVYYTGVGDAGYDLAWPHADWILTDNGTRNAKDWSIGDCQPQGAANYPTIVKDKPVTTLSGWSRGRLGPIYLLKANAALAAQTRYVLMFDPGSYGEMDCDRRIKASQLLADWLTSNLSNRLVIMAGEFTMPDRARGIQDSYFTKIRGKGISSQVLVCNVANANGDPWSHKDVLKVYAGMIHQPPPTKCPSNFVGWRP